MRAPTTCALAAQLVSEFATFLANRADSCLKIKWNVEHAQKARLTSFVFVLLVVTQQSGLLASLRNVAFILGIALP